MTNGTQAVASLIPIGFGLGIAAESAATAKRAKGRSKKDLANLVGGFTKITIGTALLPTVAQQASLV